MATPSASTDVLDITDLEEVLNILEDRNFPKHQWGDLGLKLGIIQPVLDTIRVDKHDSNDCLKECLSRWLQQNGKCGKPTKMSLVAAIDKMGQKPAASGNEGKQPVPTQNHELSRKIANVMPMDRYLYVQFCSLVNDVQSKMKCLNEAELQLVVHNIGNIFPILLNGLSAVSCSKTLFKLISKYYSYQEFEIIVALVNCSRSADLFEQLLRYMSDLEKYEKSTNLSNLKPFSCGEMFLLTSGEVTLHNRWDGMSIHSLRELLQHYLINIRFHFNNIERTHDNNLRLSFRVQCQSESELQLTAKGNIVSLHRMGVIKVVISSKTVTLEGCVNFDQSLIVAVKSNLEREVSVLLDLGANPDYRDSKGQTARELACNDEIKKLLDQVTCQRTGIKMSQTEIRLRKEVESLQEAISTLKCNLQESEKLAASYKKKITVLDEKLRLQEIHSSTKDTQADRQCMCIHDTLVCDVMKPQPGDPPLETIDLSKCTVGSLRKVIRESDYFGYPCVLSHDTQLLEGFLTRKDIITSLELIDAKQGEGITDESRVFFLDKSHRLQEEVVDSDTPSVNMRETIDPAHIQISDQTPMQTVVKLFGKMGLRQAFVSRNGRLLGIVTKKDMLRHVAAMEYKNPHSIQYH